MQLNERKIFGVVPTYNRPKLLIRNIESLLENKELSKIIVIDNGSKVETEKTLKDTYGSRENIIYIKLEKNIGASGAFKLGMETAIENGADYIWAMDDDAFPKDNALTVLMEEYMKLDKDSVLWSNCDDDESEKLIYSVNQFMFVGFFISKEIVADVGYPDTKFFMYYDDYDYSQRIKMKGYDIYRVVNSIIYHKDWTRREDENTKHIKILGFKIDIKIIEDIRFFYISRNFFFLNHSTLNKIKFAIKIITKAALYSFYSLKSSKAMLMGLIHGIFKLSIGKYEFR